jgi:hypothetical protein
MAFVNSMSDLFHEDVPDDYVQQVVRVIQMADWHTYQVLTKRRAPARLATDEASWRGRGDAHLVGNQRGKSQTWLASHRSSSCDAGPNAVSFHRAAARRPRHIDLQRIQW